MTTNTSLQVPEKSNFTGNSLYGSPGRRGSERPGDDAARRPTLWILFSGDLHGILAGPVWVSCLQVRHVPQSAGYRADRGMCLLPRERAHSIPRSCLENIDLRLREHSDLDL